MNEKIEVPTMKVPPLKKICMTIGQLPASYVESMSYYEMLVWFVHYLRDDIIPVVNANGEATRELQELYVELQDYVNNYFDNLDVQEEINNKLDEMAESGQLTDIIAQYLGLAGMITFNSVAEMKAAQNLVNGSKCATLGFYNVNDGGNALYKVRTITNDDIVDERTIIALYDDLLIAELIHGESVNVLQLGFKNDGLTDISTALQSLLTRNIIKTYYFPAGNYLLSDEITLEDSVSFIGCKKPNHSDLEGLSKIIIDEDAENFTAFTIINGPHPTFKNLAFISSSYNFTENRNSVVSGSYSTTLFTETTSKENVNGINCQGSSNNIYDCLFYGFSGYAIGVRYSSKYENNVFFKCKYCYYASYTSNKASDITIDNDKCYWVHNYYKSNGGGLVMISNLTLDSCSTYVLDLKDCSQHSFVNSRCDYVLYAYVKADACINCTFENIKGRAAIYSIGIAIGSIADADIGKCCEFYFTNNRKGNKVNNNFIKKAGIDGNATENVPSTYFAIDGTYNGDAILTINSNSNYDLTLDESNIDGYLCTTTSTRATIKDTNYYYLNPIYQRGGNKVLRNSMKNFCYSFDMWNLPKPVHTGLTALLSNNYYVAVNTTGTPETDWVQLN